MSFRNRHFDRTGDKPTGWTLETRFGSCAQRLRAGLVSGLAVAAIVLLTTHCASLPTDYPSEPSYVLENTSDTRLGRDLGPLTAEHPAQSGFYPLIEGTDALVARLGIVDAADRSLDVQYYIWHSDSSGLALVSALVEAADRGVRVRLLLDDLDTAGKDVGIASLNAHPNIEVRLFNPFANRASRLIGFLTDLRRVNRRMHNKSMTADNQVTIVGGRNVGDEYFDAEGAAAYSDLDVLAIGPVVGEVSTAFDRYWNSDWSLPVSALQGNSAPTQEKVDKDRAALREYLEDARRTAYAEALRSSELARLQALSQLDFFWGRSTLLYDAPSKAAGAEMSAATHMGPTLRTLFGAAKEELLIVSPYFVPGDAFVNYMGELVESGVRVRILTNSMATNDVGVVHAGYMGYRHALLHRGVELYEFKAASDAALPERSGRQWTGSSRASLHAKTFSIDRRALFVGSFNFDPRSAALNTEMGVLFESPELAKRLGQIFDHELSTRAYRLELVTIPAGQTRSGFEQTEIQWVTNENGSELRYRVDPETTLGQRMGVKLLSLFVIESFL